MSNTRNTRRHPRRTTVSPHSGEGREIGLDDREIPGGLEHLVTPESPATKPAVPERPVFPEQNAHGVAPGEAPLDQPEAGKIIPAHVVPMAPEDAAVPVFIVEEPGKGRVRRETIVDAIEIPDTAADPVRICNVDGGRVEVRLLNEDTATDVRFSADPTELLEGRGAILPHAASSYLSFPTQGELWGRTTSATLGAKVSVILVTEIAV